MVHVSFPQDRPSSSPGKFLLKRACRIYPLYWLTCLVVIAMGLAGFYKQRDFSGEAIASSLALLPTHSLVGVSWTLSYEMLFYLIFASALFLRSPRGVVLFSTLMLTVVFIASSLTLPDGPWREFLARPIIFEFACGMFAALAFRTWGDRAALPLWTGIVAMLVLLVAPALTGFPDTHGLAGWPRFFAWGLPSVVVVLSVLKLQPSTGILARGGELLGDASYAIYLTHPLVATAYSFLLVRWLAPFPTLLTVSAVLIGALIGGVFTHLLVEKPLLKLTRKMLALRAPSAIIIPQKVLTET